MSAESLSDLFRAIGRLEAEIVAIREDVKELRKHRFERWKVWAGAVAGVLSTVAGGFILSRLGIHN